MGTEGLSTIPRRDGMLLGETWERGEASPNWAFRRPARPRIVQAQPIEIGMYIHTDNYLISD